MIQTIVVSAIVVLALVYLVSSIVKRLRAGDKANPCNACNGNCGLKCKP
ncbi:MAG: FeoB-associated Cys-rich membrane protein [Bacteroidales bacterium]|nr:FeoB-associated Cys-rich membrane protein [Bacteroidales bacterium]